MDAEPTPAIKQDLERLARAHRLSHQVRFYTPQEWVERELDPGLGCIFGLALLEPAQAHLLREIRQLTANSGWRMDVFQRGIEHRLEFRPAA